MASEGRTNTWMWGHEGSGGCTTPQPCLHVVTCKGLLMTQSQEDSSDHIWSVVTSRTSSDLHVCEESKQKFKMSGSSLSDHITIRTQSGLFTNAHFKLFLVIRSQKPLEMSSCEQGLGQVLVALVSKSNNTSLCIKNSLAHGHSISSQCFIQRIYAWVCAPLCEAAITSGWRQCDRLLLHSAELPHFDPRHCLASCAPHASSAPTWTRALCWTRLLVYVPSPDRQTDSILY